MTPETKLLLSVARILRARIKEDPAHPYYKDDLEALNDALAPFDPSNVVPIRPDECAQQAAPEPAEPCRSCGGTGKHHGQWLDTDQTCPDCNGTGLKAKGEA